MKQVFILISVLPNKKRWLFSRICEVGIPDFLGYKLCKKKSYNYWWWSKGDGKNLWILKKTFLNAKNVRCGWHIVDRDWERNLRCMIGSKKKYKLQWSQIKRTIQFWLYLRIKKKFNGRRRLYAILVSSILISEVKHGDHNDGKCRIFSYMWVYT